MIVVNSVLFIFFAISSQVTKASSEVCSSTTLPNPMESLERNTPHYKLPPTCWRPTPLCKTPLKRWNNLFGRGIWGDVEHCYPRWIRGSNANCPSNLRDNRVGIHFGSDIRRQNCYIFLTCWEGVAIVRWKPLFQLLGGKTQIHTGAKNQSWTVLRPKVLVNLHPLPTHSNQNHTSSPLKRLDLLFKNIKNNHTKAESRRYFNIQECEWQTNKAK